MVAIFEKLKTAGERFPRTPQDFVITRKRVSAERSAPAAAAKPPLRHIDPDAPPGVAERPQYFFSLLTLHPSLFTAPQPPKDFVITRKQVNAVPASPHLPGSTSLSGARRKLHPTAHRIAA
jgi:hypothetical protein